MRRRAWEGRTLFEKCPGAWRRGRPGGEGAYRDVGCIRRTTGPPGFEPGFEAPEAPVISKLYYGPARSGSARPRLKVAGAAAGPGGAPERLPRGGHSVDSALGLGGSRNERDGVGLFDAGNRVAVRFPAQERLREIVDTLPRNQTKECPTHRTWTRAYAGN